METPEQNLAVKEGRPNGIDWERPLSEEEKEKLAQLKGGAARAIAAFALERSSSGNKKNEKGENLLIVADTGLDPLYLRALHEAGREAAGSDFSMLAVSKTEHAAQSFEPFERISRSGSFKYNPFEHAAAVLIVTSLSRTHSAGGPKEAMHPPFDVDCVRQRLEAPEAVQRYQALRGKTPEELAELLSHLPKSLADKLGKPIGEFSSRTRIISITNPDTEILTQGGALEDPQETHERILRFAEIAKDVVEVRVTSSNGTDLRVRLKQGSRDLDTPVINIPGKIANFPAGEWAWAVDCGQTNGVYVADGAVGMIGRLKEPIKITIENGVAVKIEDGDQTRELKRILENSQRKYQEEKPDDTRTTVYRIAEFSCGMNAKAFRWGPNGERLSPPTSLEAEKGLGTTHIALGKNSIFNIVPGDPDYSDFPLHIDCVAMKPSVVGIHEDGTEIELIRDGEVVCLK